MLRFLAALEADDSRCSHLGFGLDLVRQASREPSALSGERNFGEFQRVMVGLRRDGLVEWNPPIGSVGSRSPDHLSDIEFIKSRDRGCHVPSFSVSVHI